MKKSNFRIENEKVESTITNMGDEESSLFEICNEELQEWLSMYDENKRMAFEEMGRIKAKRIPLK